MNLPDIVSVLNGNLKRKTPNDKGINHYIKNYTPILKCLGQKIVKQIDLWKKQSYKIFDKNKISAKEDNITDLKEYESTMNKFVSLARKSIPDNVFLIIFYHPNYIMQIDGKIKNDTDKSYLDIFAKVCKNNKIIFIDTDKELQNLYYTKKILPCGFINTAVGYGHLNKYGHEAIANRLAEEIKKLENNYGSK